MTMLALLGTVATGLLIGEQASADITPFYANTAIVPDHRRSDDSQFASIDEPKTRIETSDLSYNRRANKAFDDASY